ncbi:MAG: ribbon-helix-helix domain-containing protein [Hyphomicrobiales bacterium]|nr:ribbon-helix-helix domain-containing protein [Hyphomicrobiales bacterium]
MRTLINMDEKQISELDRLARNQNRSRASVIRDAVSDYLQRQTTGVHKDAFGLWGQRKADGLAYQEKMRGEW